MNQLGDKIGIPRESRAKARWWARTTANLLIALRVLASFVVVALVFYMAWTVYQLDQISQSRSDTLQAIKDCTTPGSPCFEAGQKQTAKAVGSINDVTMAAAVCAKRPGVDTVIEIRTCIVSELTAARTGKEKRQ